MTESAPPPVAPPTPPAEPPDSAKAEPGSEPARESMSPASAVHREGALAFRNALKLAVSLIATWSVALVVTFKLPRYLGPAMMGDYQAALSTAATAFVFIDLGVDTYIQREVPVRPKHASDFFLGFLISRLLLSVPLFAVVAFLVMKDTQQVQIATGLFAITQVFTAFNTTFSKMLQAATQVGSLAIVNVVAKILWGGGTFLAIALKLPFIVLVMPMLASEALKAAFLYYATKRAIDLELRLDVKETLAVLRESFPFFVGAVAVTLGSQLDVVMLKYLMPRDETGRAEVGFYSAARQIANLSSLLSPVMSGVLIPMMRRARERSEEEFFVILRRVLEGVVIVSLPLTLVLALGSDVAIHYALHDPFLPAARSLTFLAPTFVFAYVNVLLWLSLMIMGRSWTITIISLIGLVFLPALIILAVPLTQGFGPGGAGLGTALALSLREFGIVVVFLAFIGKHALDSRNVGSIGKSILICVLVSAAHHYLAPFTSARGWSGGIARLALDSALYAVLALAFGVVRIADAKSVMKLMKNRGR